MKLGGVQLVVSNFEQGLWFDDDERHRDFTGWGIKVAVYYGPMSWEWPKFWKYGLGDLWKNLLNPLKNPLVEQFKIRIPFIIGPFLSVCYKKFGIYIGFKPHKDYELIPSMRITNDRRF